MKCLILAAGYATRLYPLTENFPKPLLEVGGKPILDWLIEDIDATGLVDGYVVISNHKFAPIFGKWADKRSDITVLDDGTSSNETRLGAVCDIQFAVESLGLDEDLLVIAGDNLLSFSLSGFLSFAVGKGTSCVMRYYEPDLAKLRKMGVAQIDGDGRIVSMEEKPAEPKSHWCCPPFYFYRRADVPLVAEGIAAGCGIDAPGSFIAWLASRTPVHTWEMPGRRYDIGNLESYEEVKRLFEKPKMKKVLTFGVYDMLHIGHLLLFKRAKALGDKLIVAVQDGDYIQKYKPGTEMVYTTDERLYMVSTIRYVDEVVTYKDVDVDIKGIDFDVFAVGQDQNHAGFQRAMQWCREQGKEVVVLARTEGISSTILRNYSKTK